MFKTSTYLTPAYGRQYATKAACLKDWRAGKDFKVLRGPYCSIRDYEILTIDGPVYIVISTKQHVDLAKELVNAAA